MMLVNLLVTIPHWPESHLSEKNSVLGDQ